MRNITEARICSLFDRLFSKNPIVRMDKLNEEIEELNKAIEDNSNIIEELSDVQAVLTHLSSIYNVSHDQLLHMAIEKQKQRGNF